MKNRYIGRTFIVPVSERKSVRQKLVRYLNFKQDGLRGRFGLRSTTCGQIIQMARDAGAAILRHCHLFGIQTFMVSTCPPLMS